MNWEELAGPLMHTIHREAAASEAVARLRDDLLAYPGVPVRWKVPDPRAVTLQQLRIEAFYPADAATEATALRLAAAS